MLPDRSELLKEQQQKSNFYIAYGFALLSAILTATGNGIYAY